MKNKTVNNITWGLFPYKNIYYYKNIKYIKIFFKRIFFTLKHGYAPQAQWETYAWFIDVMKEILTNYKYNRNGTPLLTENEEENNAAYDKLLTDMIELLNKMDENNPIYDGINYEDRYDVMDTAKNEFFKLFSENFWNW